ncbi:MAG: alpha-2-macroglobulin, partial [Acidobacteriota bacterium]
RLDWKATAGAPGTAKIMIVARGSSYSDAMEKTYPIFDHGIEKFIARSGKVRGDNVTVKLDLPARRRSTELLVHVTPSMAVTMLDALPYLIDYPYGCTEQTMSRFLPAAITAKTLRELGLPSDRIFETGGIEKETAGKTHAKGRKSLQQLPAMMKSGLNRLYDFQHADGGWGWWKEGESDHFMTAYVIWGFTLAKNAGLEVRSDSFERGVNFLQKEIVEEENNFDMQAWMLHALSAVQRKPRFEEKAFDNLWKNRDRLNAYTRALLALSAAAMGRSEEAQVLVRNLENGVNLDSAPDVSILIGGKHADSTMDTAHWGEDGIYWRWSDGGVEATAFALKALLTIDPQNKLVEPVTNWLIKNRRGAQWHSTRDTAIVVLALNDYLKQSGEMQTDLEFELSVNGKSVATHQISPSEIFDAPSVFQIDPQLIREQNQIRIRRTKGSGPIY